MPAPQNNQGFVNPQSGGTGNWLGKLFGGIGANYRARSMAQLQLDLHGERAKIDTEHFKERQTHKATVDAAAKSYLSNEGFGIEKKRARFYKKEGANLSDVTQSSATSIAFQKKGLADRAAGSQQRVETPEQPTPTATPPADRATNPARKPRGRSGTIKEVTAAMDAGQIDQEQAAHISPAYAAKVGRQTTGQNVAAGASETPAPKARRSRNTGPTLPKVGE